MLRIFAIAVSVIGLAAGQAVAQEPNPIKLNGNGDFYGKTVTKNGEETQGIKAQVTLTLDGKTIHSVVSDEAGLFSFSDVAPGVYTITATADTYVSTETINVEAPVEPATTAEPSTEPAITLPLEPIADDMSSMYSMPMSSMAAAPSFSSGSGCSSCGGGTGGGSCGRGGFGRLLPLIGLVGLAGLGNNASPAN